LQTGQMPSAILIFLVSFACSSSVTPDEHCSLYSNTDCRYCQANADNFSCGYCISTKECLPGDSDGPFNLTCDSWAITDTPECKTDSQLGVSTPVRIGVCAYAAVVAIGTAVFWIWGFPLIAHKRTLNAVSGLSDGLYSG
jgi:hypothetical protein